MLIINTGGTFNKKYNKLNGELENLNNDDSSIIRILESSFVDRKIINIFSKDSLHINTEDRIKLSNFILESEEDEIIIIHGTDTVNETASFISESQLNDKKIIFTGAMKPFEIENIEATFNLGVSIGAMKFCKPGIYICMNGFIEKHTDIFKNTKLGRFEI